MTKDDKQAFEVPDRLFEYVRAVVDNRALATVLLFLLSLLLIGIGNIAGILAVLLIGFLLIDRFEIVRRCVVIGGAAWAMTLAIGAMALGGIEGPVLFDAGFVFNMLGFVLALAVCVLFFCGRALYYQGYEQGERHSDRVLAARIQDRLIDHPDAWDNIDGDFLEVEGALNRVRDRERKVQQALRDGDLDYVVSQGISQQEQGADILDVNVGLPEIDEVKIIQQATEQLQGSTLLPLQIDSTDPAAVEAAVRRYAGKPIINSVNGKQQIMDEIFPLVAHYGTNVVGLTLDEGGIPDTAEARFAIAERIVAEAARYGIGPDRILIDCLVMTASTNQRQAEQILRAMSLCKERLGVKCALGVSNISFGLPARPLLGSVFLAAAFGAGLDAPIMNPGSKRFMDTVYSYRVLSVEDEGSTGYIERYAGWTDPYKIAANPAAAQSASSDAAPAASTTASAGDDPIRHMVVSGRKGEIAAETERLLADHDAMDLINNHFIPALDEVGVLFDQGKFFLPQLMASAEAARVGFDTIKRLMPAGEIADKGKICVATVKGDIHDIGKNIVKMLLDNYGYTVFDLGRDVDPQEVLKTVRERDIKLVGLSALMTTTVVAMEVTIKLLHAEVPGVKIIVGGAVLTPEYAKQIGADYYAKDAAESARIAEEVFGQ